MAHRFLFIWPVSLLILLAVGSSPAQAASIDPTGRSSELPRPRAEEIQPPPATPEIVLPPVPLLPKEKPDLSSLQAFIREIRVIGSTVFSPEEIAQVTGRYTNRTVTAEDLEALRTELTYLYVNKGYVNSGAILPDQTITDGVVIFQIIEGELTGIEVQGNSWFRSSYLTKRISLGAEPPLNLNTLQDRLRLLLEDPRIRRLNAELKPGLKPGDSILDVRVEERTPYKLWLDFDNYQPPSVGEYRGIIGLEHENLTGNGDILTAQYGRSTGLNPLLDFKYSLPFTAYDTTGSFQYRKNTLAVIQQPFTTVNVKSNSDIYTVAVRQPIYRTINTEFAAELIGEHEWLETFLLGQPFSLEPGAQNGKSAVTALRFAQDWVYRTQSQVIAARSRVSFGLNALGATINNNGQPDGIFTAWLGQFQWVQRLGILDSQMIFRSSFQLSDRGLLSLEQISVGGRYSVRGYLENQLLTDEAVLTSVEMRVPLIANTPVADYLEFAPFMDFGNGWNKNRPSPTPHVLQSAGIGFRWGVTLPWWPAVPLRPQFEFYWGYRLRKVENLGNSLQAHGISLQCIVAAF